MEDSEIISLLESRDERAIDEIRAKYSAYLLTIAKNVTGADRDAEECENETYFRTWNSIPPNRPAYGIVEGARGVFDRVDGNGIYHSFVYDLNPADLPALIAAADEQWVPIYEQYADNPI